MSIHEHHSPHGEAADAEAHQSRVPKLPPHHPAHDARISGRWVVGVIAVTLLYFLGAAVHDSVQERARFAHEARMLTGASRGAGVSSLAPSAARDVTRSRASQARMARLVRRSPGSRTGCTSAVS